MDKSQRILFGDFPRFVANPMQWPALNEDMFDMFLDHNEGESQCYSRISWYSPDGSLMLDRVFLDLDGNKPEDMTDTEMIDSMRSNPSVAEQILGEVVEDSRSIAKLCREESIPVVGVYTGKGMHIHALFEVRKDPRRELRSLQNWMVDKADLKTFDSQVRGDVKRLCRVPNCRRYDDRLDSPIDMWTVPLDVNELSNLTIDKLLEWSRNPRQIDVPGESRPPFIEAAGYTNSRSYNINKVEQREVGQMADTTDKLEKWLQDVLQLPCMYNRIMTRNPAHYVRLNSAVMMFNAGLSVDEVLSVFTQLNWRDSDVETTRRHLTQIYMKGYSSMSCSTIQMKGLCVFDSGERKDRCDHYGYEGGQLFY
jgi:hypothetical protein